MRLRLVTVPRARTSRGWIEITDGSQLRQAVLRALESRVQAQLVPLVDDGTLSVERSHAQEAVRTLVFESEHRCEVIVRSAARHVTSVRFQTDSRAAFDIELSQTSGEEQTTRTRAAEPAVFRSVKAGPARFVYSLSDEGAGSRRYQTAWVLLP
jgi:hypothetical protein